jgi:2-hydroxychromene-2-carboxylate isomerase
VPRPPRRPRWYFSLRSPYSWFAYRDLAEHHPDVLDAAEWVPYWEPDAAGERALAERNVRLPVVEMSKAKALYILSDARRLASDRGLTVTWPVDREPRWEVAHLGYLAAEDEGRGRAYVDAIYRARWQQGLDISSAGTVARAAAEVGADPERVAAAADDPVLRARGLECLVSAYKDDAFGVPFFTSGRERFWGVERVPAWVAAVRGGFLAAPEPVPSTQDLLPAGLDASHAGGCG